MTAPVSSAELRSHVLYVSGLHCAACTVLVADVLSEVGLRDVHVSLADGKLTFHTERAESAEELARLLTPLVVAHGYILHAERPGAVRSSYSVHEWFIAVMAALAIVGIFFLLDRVGIASVLGNRESSLMTAFLVGLVASVSSCLAVVGGLVLSRAATEGKAGTGYRSQVYFHIGRLGGFALLGGLLGALGSVVRLGVYGSALLGIVVSIVMLVLGLQLLDVPGIRLPTLPSTWFAGFRRVASGMSSGAPMLLGAATFFLPCGFTQSMQVVALGSGSVATGGLTMLMFALGTLPMLAALSFGSLDIAKSSYRDVFFKAAGLLVIGFALMNGFLGLRVLGIITL